MTIETVGMYAVIVTAFFVALQAVAVSLQAWHIRGGLRQMREASRQRDRQLDQQAADSERRHQEVMLSLAEQHRATMKGLEALIERTAPPPREAAE